MSRHRDIRDALELEREAERDPSARPVGVRMVLGVLNSGFWLSLGVWVMWAGTEWVRLVGLGMFALGLLVARGAWRQLAVSRRVRAARSRRRLASWGEALPWSTPGAHEDEQERSTSGPLF